MLSQLDQIQTQIQQMISIRPFELTDLDDYMDMWWSASRAGHPFISEETHLKIHDEIRDILLPESETYCAFDGDTLVGAVSLKENAVVGLFVHTDFHRHGYGLALMNYVRAQRPGVPLEVAVFEQNMRAVHFYRRFGFEQIGRKDIAAEDLPFRLLLLRLAT